MTKILIVDDHDVVRAGIRALLARHDGWHICGEAATGREGVAKAIELRPDLVILDVGMPEMNGLEATREIHRTVPTARILILTVHDVEQLAQDFVNAGAHGFILKSDASRILVDAVDTILHRGTFFSPRLQEVVDHWDRSGARDTAPASGRLTKREREVLQLLAEGKSNKEIGTAMHISAKTAETHRARLMSKLDMHSVAGLVRYAIRNQIVDV